MELPLSKSWSIFRSKRKLAKGGRSRNKLKSMVENVIH
jgi:hypothetical protein